MNFAMLVGIVHLFKRHISLTNIDRLLQRQIQKHFLLLLWCGGGLVQGGYPGDNGQVGTLMCL